MYNDADGTGTSERARRPKRTCSLNDYPPMGTQDRTRLTANCLAVASKKLAARRVIDESEW